MNYNNELILNTNKYKYVYKQVQIYSKTINEVQNVFKLYIQY